MKKVFRTIGVIVLLLAVYSMLQGFFTFLAMCVTALVAAVQGKLDIGMLTKLDGLADLNAMSGMSGVFVWSLAMGLMLSTVAMLLFLHFTGLFKLRWSLFKSISFRPLLFSTLLVFTSMFALNIFVQWFNLNDNLADQFDGLVHNVVGAFTVSVLAPLLEEAMFRGAMQGYMMRRFNPWVGIVVAALVFGVFHMNPVQIMYATLLGVVFGWIYYRTRSLMSVIVGHVLNNSIATAVMLLFPASEMEQVSATQPTSVEFGFEVMTFMGFVALSLLLAVKLHRMLPPVSRPWSDVCDKI